jgi:enolase
MAATSGVQEYIDKFGLQTTVESVLNSCVKAKPDEPLSFMVGLGRQTGAG